MKSFLGDKAKKWKKSPDEDGGLEMKFEGSISREEKHFSEPHLPHASPDDQSDDEHIERRGRRRNRHDHDDDDEHNEDYGYRRRNDGNTFHSSDGKGDYQITTDLRDSDEEITTKSNVLDYSELMDSDSEEEEHLIEHPLGSWNSGAAAPRVVIWSVLKSICYSFSLCVVGFVLVANYSLSPCYEIAEFDFCIISDANQDCVSAETNANCYEACVALDGSITDDRGCYTFSPGSENWTCLSHNLFTEQCLDTSSCQARYVDDLKDALLYIVVVLSVTLAIELQLMIGLSRYGSLHSTEFLGTSVCNQCQVTMTKQAPYLLQLFLLFSCFSLAYSLLKVSAANSHCPDATTVSGSPYEFFDDAYKAVLGTTIGTTVLVIIGTWTRYKLPFRGELYSPSMLDDQIVPHGLTCYTCRSRSKYKCCRGCFRACAASDNVCLACCAQRCSGSMDFLICTFPFCGDYICAFVDFCYRERHYIGP